MRLVSCAGRANVDDALRHQGTDQLEKPVEHQATERGGNQPAVGPDVHHQPADKTRVVRLPDDVLFVKRHR
jgi:hypothetical protein